MAGFETQLDECRNQVAQAREALLRFKDMIASGPDDTQACPAAGEGAEMLQELSSRQAEILMELDKIANQLSDDFSMICARTRFERMVAMISTRLSQVIYASRLKETFLKGALSELITQSDQMADLIQGHRDIVGALNKDFPAIARSADQENLALEVEHQHVMRALDSMDRACVELENKIVIRASGGDQAHLAEELAEKRREHSALEEKNNAFTVRRAELQMRAKAAQQWAVVLKEHADTQRVLMRKLEADIRYRMVLSEAFYQASTYEPLISDTEKVSDIGADTLAEYYPLNAARPTTPTSARMADMLGAYGDPALFAKLVRDQKDMTDAVFKERVARIMEKKAAAVADG